MRRSCYGKSKQSSSVKQQLDNAAFYNNKSEVERLLPRLRNPGRSEWRYNACPLQVAASNGHVDVIRLMLEHGFDVNSTRPGGWAALHEAGWAGHPEVIKILLAAGADVNQRNDAGRTPLYLAAENDKAEAFKVLLEVGSADVCARDFNGWSPIHRAAYYSRLPVVRMLLDGGARVDQRRSADGWTALHLAALCNNPGVVELLLERGANPKTKNAEGKVPVEIAEAKGNQEVVAILENYDEMKAKAAREARKSREEIAKAQGLLGNIDNLPAQMEVQKKMLEDILAKGLSRQKEIEELKQSHMDEVGLEKTRRAVEEKVKELKAEENEIEELEQSIVDTEARIRMKKEELEEAVEVEAEALRKKHALSALMQKVEADIKKTKVQIDSIQAEIVTATEENRTKIEKKKREEVKKVETETAIAKLKADLAENQTLEEAIEAIRARGDYQSETQIKALQTDIKKLDDRLSSHFGRPPSADIPDDGWQAELSCCVCLEIPRNGRVLTCQQDHVICEGCDQLLKTRSPYLCPQCREDLEASPLRRNHMAERMIRRI